jgi:hypothetical protein
LDSESPITSSEEIKITPEMIEAGASELIGFRADRDDPGDVAWAVFLSMAEAADASLLRQLADRNTNSASLPLVRERSE